MTETFRRVSALRTEVRTPRRSPSGPAPVRPSPHHSRSYSGYHESCVDLYEPRDLDELRALLKFFHDRRLSFSLLGGGVSFDGHFIHPERSISLRAFDTLQIDTEARTMTVGAGQRWGPVVRALLARGFVPYITPTTAHATVGGTVSCDTYSRMTPGYGRESRWIRSLMLLTTEGELLRCSRTRESELFWAAIGGLGSVGLVVEVEYDILYVGENPALRTPIASYEGICGIDQVRPENPFPGRERTDDMPGGACVLIPHRGGTRSLLIKHRWVDTTERVHTLVHDDTSVLRIVGDYVHRTLPQAASWMWNGVAKHCRRLHDPVAIDDAYGAIFMMETNRTSKELAARLGVRTRIVQHSYAVPCRHGDDRDVDAIHEFSRMFMDRLRRAKLHPVMTDVGFIPGGKSGLLSANQSQDAYLFSVALEGRSLWRREPVFALLAETAQLLHERYGGRLHLTKNVLVPDPLLRAMYRPQLHELERVKRAVDPGGLLRTQLLDRLLPGVASSP